MFSKVLVANPGEIAIRAFRAGFELGARTVVVLPVAARDRSIAAEASATEKADPRTPGQVAAPFAGVVTVVVEQGARVGAGETVATIEAMKMEAAITAPRVGTVERVALDGTQAVEGGDLVLVLG